MRTELRCLVEEAYEKFATYRVNRSLTVCHCSCCMTEADEHLLIKTPLREIPSTLLAEYTNSAHSWDDGPVAREMRYFLPRYFELLADNDPPDTCSMDICLRRLRYADWRAKWPERECAIIDRFFDELLLQGLERTDLVQWPVGWRLAFDIADILTLVVTAHGDLHRVLATWETAADPGASVHLAAVLDRLHHEAGRTYFHSAYLDEYPEEADAIAAFLARPSVVPRVEAAFFELTDPRLQKLVSDAVYLT